MERRLAAAIILAALIISWGMRYREARKEFTVLDGWTGELVIANPELAKLQEGTFMAAPHVRSKIVSGVVVLFSVGLVVIVVWPTRRRDQASDNPTPGS